MKARFALLGLFVFALASAGQDPAAVKSAIQKEMNGYVAAMKKRDVKAVEKFIMDNFAQEFRDTDLKGVTRTRQQTVEAVRQNISMLKTVKAMSIEIKSIKMVGGKAITSEQMVLDATINGMSPDKPTSTLKVDSMWQGTYEKRGAKWICTLSKTVKEKVMIDGKPIG